MKIKTVILFLMLSLLCINYAIGQRQQPQFSRDFGQVTAAEVIASGGLGGGDADAVVIHCIGKYSFPDDKDFLTGLEPFPLFRKDMNVKIKILTDEGIRYATFEFPHENFSYNANIFDIEEGYTYNIDGSSLLMTKLSNADIVDKKMPDGSIVRKIVFPDVKAGSVIELKTTQWYKSSRMPIWHFQQDIPVLNSEIIYTTSPYLNYSVILKGAAKYSYNRFTVIKGDQAAAYVSEPDKVMYIYGMNDLAAFPAEQLTNNTSDGKIKTIFRLKNSISPKNLSSREYAYTWENTIEGIADKKSFSRLLKAEDKGVKNILSILPESSKGRDKTAANTIFGYVQDNFKWNGVYSIYSSQRISDIIKKKNGNVADINLLLVSLLKGAGITAYPVVLSTRNNGGIDENFPDESYFNYVVAKAVIDDDVYYLDAADSYTCFGELPARSANVEGLVIGAEGVEWCNTLQDDFYADETSANISANPKDGILTVDVERTFSGYAASYLRKLYGEGVESVHSFLCDGNSLNITDVVVDGKIKGEPMVVKYKYNVAVEADKAGSFTLNPSQAVDLQDDLLSQESLRRFPVSVPFRPWVAYKIKLSIPEGYKVDTLSTDDVVRQGDDLFMSYKVKQENGTVAVESDYYFGKTDYPASAYTNLKKSYSELLGLFSQPIVFSSGE